MPYLWANTEMIQGYMGNSTIRVGGTNTNFEEASAMLYENEAVDEVSTLIGIAWDGLGDLTASNAPGTLKRMAARLAAAKIQTAAVGSALGALPAWCVLARKEVFSQLRRMLIAHETTDLSPLTKRPGITLQDVLIKAKIREFEESTETT